MKVSDIVEARRQRALVVHGTSSALLKSILKHGMMSSPKQRVWGADSGSMGIGSLETVGGSYWTREPPIARDSARDSVKKFGGNKLYVFATISEGSAYADEDNVSNTVEDVFTRVIQSEYPRSHIHMLKTWIDVVNQSGVRYQIMKKFGRSLHLKLRSSEKQPANWDLLDETFKAYLAWRVYSARDRDTVGDVLSINTDDAASRLQVIYDKLTKYYTSTVYTDVSFRVTGDVGYGGSNRIIAILEDTGDSLVPRYGSQDNIKRAVELWRSYYKINIDL
jgi:hypothetical protein